MSATEKPTFETITVKELHPTFAAEVQGVNFQDLSDKQFGEVSAALAKYGVCVFRNTGLDDTHHVDFSRRLGELDTTRRYMVAGRKARYEYYELFDAGNVDENGNVLDPNGPKAQFGKGNLLFHVDSSFNPRRASYSCLRAVEIPPPGQGLGGNTDFADSRTAYDDLDEATKKDLLAKDYVGAHTIAYSRKLGSPEFFKDLDPTKDGFSRHRIVQKHEPSGRMNLYIAAHLHHIEGLSDEESMALRNKLLDHVSQPKYCISLAWENPSDMIIWDNRCLLHRAAGGAFEGKYRRDLRRTTVHDDSPTAWGLNKVDMSFVEPKSTADAAHEEMAKKMGWQREAPKAVGVNA